eukprot:3480614-Amphidinium_carterae.1
MVLFFDAESKQLIVVDSFLEQQDFLEILTSTLLCMWRFSKFCASRWTTIGHSCRTIALACSTGFTECFKFLHERKFVSDFEASGAELLNLECKKFCLCVGLAAYLPEVFLTMLMDDNRLLQTHKEVESAMAEELSFLEGIEPVVWDMFAKLFCLNGVDVRQLTLATAHTAYGYLEWR